MVAASSRHDFAVETSKLNKFQAFLEAVLLLPAEQQQEAIREEFSDDILIVFTLCVEFLKSFSCLAFNDVLENIPQNIQNNLNVPKKSRNIRNVASGRKAEILTNIPQGDVPAGNVPGSVSGNVPQNVPENVSEGNVSSSNDNSNSSSSLINDSFSNLSSTSTDSTTHPSNVVSTNGTDTAVSTTAIGANTIVSTHGTNSTNSTNTISMNSTYAAAGVTTNSANSTHGTHGTHASTESNRETRELIADLLQSSLSVSVLFCDVYFAGNSSSSGGGGGGGGIGNAFRYPQYTR